MKRMLLILISLAVVYFLAFHGPDRRSRPAPATAEGPGAGTGPATPPTLSGRIVDDLGTPLADVTVIAAPWDERIDNGSVVTAITDADGRFALVPDPSVELVLAAQHPHHPPRVFPSIPMLAGRNHDLGILLLPARSGLLVEVSSPSQLPLSGIRVALRPRVVAADLPPAIAAIFDRTSRTESDGIATFYGVSPGPWTIRLQGENGATATVDHEQPPDPEVAPRVTATLPASTVLSGRAVDEADRGIPDALVLCHARTDVDQPLAETRTDADGGFRLAGLAPGPQTVTILSTRGSITVDPVEPEDGAMILRLPAGRAIHGMVQDSRTHRPVADAVVTAIVDAGWPLIRQGRVQRPQTTTDGSGKFTMRGLPPGILRLHASSKGLCPGTSGPIPAGDTQEPIVVPVHQGFRVTGQILSPTGLPQPHAVIRPLTLPPPGHPARPDSQPWESGPRHPGVQCDAAGRFEIQDLGPGSYRLAVACENLPSFWSMAFTATPGGERDFGTLRLRQGGSIAGRTLDAAGAPVGHATVHIVPVIDPTASAPPDGARLQIESDGQGEFRAPAVAPGSYRMFYDYHDQSARAVARSRHATAVRVSVEDRKTLQQDLRPRAR